MYKLLFFWWLIFKTSIAIAVTTNQLAHEHPEIDPILVSVGAESTSKLNFEILFHNWLKQFYPDEIPAQTSADKFLDAFIKYKLLTQETTLFFADKNHTLIDEFENYFSEKIDSKEFFTEVEEQVIRQAFIRSHYMIDADHVLLSFGKNDDEESKTAIYNKALQLKNKLNNNETGFEQLVVDYSDDPHSKDNNGRIGLFTVFEQIYPIESAAYEQNINSVSLPVNSRFGYHLVRTRKKIRMPGLKHVSHILIKVSENHTDAEKKIFDIYSKLTTETFSKLARQYSDDYKSSIKGGELGSDRLTYELELKKHKLSEGNISRPFRSQFGWHIMKVDEVDKFEPYWQQRSNLRKVIQLDSRTERAINSLKSAQPTKSMQKLKNTIGNFL